ncbi:MAG: UDP-N-acetylglucosamine 2-epimerase [Candidatus Ranarchaeia archaeon]
MKKIIFVTGSRSEYGLMRNILKDINEEESLDLGVVVTGMHLSDTFGQSYELIKKDNLKILKEIPSISSEDTGIGVSKSISILIKELLPVFQDFNPDIVLLIGDRWEMLATAIVGSYDNKILIHLHGGEKSGSIDDSVRHTLSTFSHYHLVSLPEYKKRLIKRGEKPEKIQIIGSPGLDDIYLKNFTEPEEIHKKFNIDRNNSVLLIVQHPVSSELERTENQIQTILDSVRELGYQSIIIYPNSDAGGRKIIEVIERERKKNPKLSVFKNLSREDYLGLMNVVNALIGNSSSGIIEAPSLHLPVVNIGTRQNGRIQGKNIINVKTFDKSMLKEAIIQSCDTNFRKDLYNTSNPYGNGNSAKEVTSFILNLDFKKIPRQKEFSY